MKEAYLHITVSLLSPIYHDSISLTIRPPTFVILHYPGSPLPRFDAPFDERGQAESKLQPPKVVS